MDNITIGLIIHELNEKARRYIGYTNDPSVSTDTAYYYAQAYLDSIEIIKKHLQEAPI